MFQKMTMSSFTFQQTSMSSVIYTFKRRQFLHLHFKRLQCLQSFTLSKDDNVFIYISKDFNVFSHLRFQKTTMSSFTFQDFNAFLSFIGLNVLVFVLHKTRHPLFLWFEEKKQLQMSSALQNFNVLMFSRFHFLGSPVARSNSKIAQTKLVSLSLLPFYF